jgi:hypothetical protein
MGVLHTVHCYLSFRKLKAIRPPHRLPVEAIFAESVTAVGGDRLKHELHANDAEEFFLNVIFVHFF